MNVNLDAWNDITVWFNKTNHTITVNGASTPLLANRYTYDVKASVLQILCQHQYGDEPVHLLIDNITYSWDMDIIDGLDLENSQYDLKVLADNVLTSIVIGKPLATASFIDVLVGSILAILSAFLGLFGLAFIRERKNRVKCEVGIQKE